MDIPKNLKYTKNHEWILVDGETAKVGITEFAQSELGEIVFVELPGIEDEFDKEETLCTVESTKAVSEVYAPISCEVVEVNEILEDSPENINESPYDEGWICSVKISDESELEELLTPKEYEEIIKE